MKKIKFGGRNKILTGCFFVLLLILVFFVLNYDQILFLRPMSIHQWAQCDRASVARNYAQESMNFFHPRTHFLSNSNGVTGMEFPLMNYLAAICYKLFGFDEFWYRMLSLLFLSVGLFFTFRIADLFLNHFLISAVLTLSWYLSPILCYYSPNFLSDAASLGFIMSAWYFYFLYREQPTKRFLYFFFLFASCACLIKITSLISIVVILILTLIEYFSNSAEWLKQLLTPPAIRRKKIIICSLLVFLSVIAWYGYAATLSSRIAEKVFLVGINPPQSWSDFPWVCNDIKKLWLPYYYHWIMYIVYGISILILCVRFKKQHALLRLITIGLGLGTVCFIFLFFNQYRLHDYYIITLLPFFFFLLITVLKYLQSVVSNQRKLNYSLCLFFALTCCVSAWWCRNYLDEKYAFDHYPYYNIENYLTAFGVKPTDKVITLFDNSFNIQLYLMNRKGWRIEEGKITSKKVEDYIKRGARFIVINDTSAINNIELNPYLGKETGEFLGVHIYSVR